MAATVTRRALPDDPAWAAVAAAAEALRAPGAPTLASLFAADPDRFAHLHVVVEGREGPLLIDYSKNLVTREAITALLTLARARGVPAALQALVRGDRVNTTEQRAALHMALRRPVQTTAADGWPGAEVRVGGTGDDVTPAVHAVLDQMEAFAESVRSGRWTGQCRAHTPRTPLAHTQEGCTNT
jgi:glucose-6-phosphate isomerase